MLTYLKDHAYYEDLYDHGTVEQCRSAENIVNGAFHKLEETTPAREFKDRAVAWYIEYSKLYLQLVELTAAGRQYHRDKVTAEWIERDAQKDQRLADARLSKMPFCRRCGKNMEVVDKYYLHREGRTSSGSSLSSPPLTKCSL